MIMAALAAGTSAMRADDLSDLVAAVAHRQNVERILGDAHVHRFDTLPRYKPLPRRADLDPSILDGVYRSMRRNIPEQYRIAPRPTLALGNFFRPVPGAVTSRFGWREQFQRIHHGIDLRLNVGDTVRAARTGTVLTVGYDPAGYGHYVVLTHPDGMETVYGHLEYSLVAQGQPVAIGAPVAIGGNTGNSTGPHLHFETRVEGHAVDPTLLFDFNCALAAWAPEEPSPAPKQANVYTHQQKSIAGDATYIVRFGDTQQSVANQAGISIGRLCQLNMLREGEPLETGRMLKLR